MNQLVMFSISIIIFTVNLYFLGLIWFADKQDAKVRYLMAMGVATCYWTIFDAILMISAPYSYAFFYTLRSIMLLLAPYFFFGYVARISGLRLFSSKPVMVPVVALLVSDVALLLTNNAHRLIFAKDGIPLPEYGPLFAYHAGLAYAGVALSVILLCRYIFKTKPPRAFAVSWILCCAIPIAVNVLFTVGVITMQQDVAPFGFALMFILFSLYFYRTRLSHFKASALTDVFESYGDAILLVDTKGVITDTNPAFVTSFPEFTLTVGKTTLEEFKDYIASVVTEETRDEKGRKQFSLGRRTPDGADEIRTFNIIRQNVYSRTRRMSGQLIILSDVSAYLDMVREAEEASSAKSAFLAHMSHEMRTPLNAILGVSEMALRKVSDSPSADLAPLQGDLEKIYGSGKNLLSVINDVLDISKIESGHLDLVENEYEVASLLSDAVSQNIVRIADKPVVFRFEVDERIPKKLRGDALRVQQILNNYLSNAVKYTKRGEVRLMVSVQDTDARDGSVDLLFSVSDTGQGIREEDIPEIFKDYKKVNERDNQGIEGTGLGLSITRELAERMGGGVSVTSVYGKGSTFLASIRQAVADPTPIGPDVKRALESFAYREERASAHSAEIVSMPWVRVLVVDDVDINLEVAKEMLAMFGIEADLAEGGREAVALVREAKTRYDLILMDHQMPDLDGVQAVRIIRDEIGTDYAQDVPIVALTANAILGSEQQYYENGFDGVLTKPVDIESLGAVLRRFAPPEA